MPGVEIKYIKVGGGGDMLRAIAGEQIDFGGLGNPPAAIGVTRGLPIQGIMVLNMLDYVEALAVRTLCWHQKPARFERQNDRRTLWLYDSLPVAQRAGR